MLVRPTVFRKARPLPKPPAGPRLRLTNISPYSAPNLIAPPQQESCSTDPDPKNSALDLDSNSEPDSPLVSQNSIFRAISNGISAVMAWYTDPPAAPLAEELISVSSHTSPSSNHLSSSLATGIKRRARQTVSFSAQQKDRRQLVHFGLGTRT